MKQSLVGMMLCGLWLLVLVGGCNSENQKLLPLESTFLGIEVGQSEAVDVVMALPGDGMMQTAASVLVLRDEPWVKELGIVTFDEEDSRVSRTIYLQRRSGQALVLTDEKLEMVMETEVPAEVLDEPYESQGRKSMAILEYCHKALVDDGSPYNEDRMTESLLGMARTGLGTGILELSSQLRKAGNLGAEPGFEYSHPSLSKCRLVLMENGKGVYTLRFVAHGIVDPFENW